MNDMWTIFNNRICWTHQNISTNWVKLDLLHSLVTTVFFLFMLPHCVPFSSTPLSFHIYFSLDLLTFPSNFFPFIFSSSGHRSHSLSPFLPLLISPYFFISLPLLSSYYISSFLSLSLFDIYPFLFSSLSLSYTISLYQFSISIFIKFPNPVDLPYQ